MISRVATKVVARSLTGGTRGQLFNRARAVAPVNMAQRNLPQMNASAATVAFMLVLYAFPWEFM
jgi:hypothetical protein